jgi:uncharacterized protein (DUF58 family)
LISGFRQRVSDWIFRARAPEAPPVVLVQRRVFILPTRHGYTFAFVLVLLLLASINYQLSLGYFLVFLLASMGGTAMLHTFRNLARLSLSPGRSEPVFAGETALFHLVLENTSLPRFSVGVRRRDTEPDFCDIAPGTTTTAEIPVAAERRGLLHCGRLEIFTEYPLGLFHAWSYVDFDSRCIVYPKPDPAAGALPVDASHGGDGSTLIAGDDEFHMLRDYRAGDSPRQIAWKALAREQGMLTKEFMSTASSELWLDWERFEGLQNEERLARLAHWVLEAERLGVVYGLRIPGTTLVPARGDVHRRACLEALALFGIGTDHAP